MKTGLFIFIVPPKNIVENVCALVMYHNNFRVYELPADMSILPSWPRGQKLYKVHPVLRCRYLTDGRWKRYWAVYIYKEDAIM